MRRALALVVLLAGCGAKSRLDGTISADATLSFEEVRAEWLVDRLFVRYLSGGGRALQEPVRLTMDAALAVEGAELAIERSVLVEHFSTVADATGRRTAENPFPRVESGVLRLSTVSRTEGELVVGDFKAVFAGAQDTLNGDFEAIVTAPR